MPDSQTASATLVIKNSQMPEADRILYDNSLSAREAYNSLKSAMKNKEIVSFKHVSSGYESEVTLKGEDISFITLTVYKNDGRKESIS